MSKFACPYTGETYDLWEFEGYEFISTLPREQARALLDSIIQRAYSTHKTYNDDVSSFVADIETEHHSKIILKVPRERNNRSWERFLTLFRPNEAFRTFASMAMLTSIGLKCPRPLLAAHRKEKGMSTDSFFVYAFVEGSPATREDVSKLFEAMRSLHQAGYLRSDPKPANFVISNGDVVFIDFRLKKPAVLTRFQLALNLCRFLHLTVSQEREDLDRYFEGNSLLKLAHPLLMFKSKARQIKRGVKKTLTRQGN